MTEQLANSLDDLKLIEQLLDKAIPNYRKAYSDRSAWLMACLSELAYIKFNPLFSSEQQQQAFIDLSNRLLKSKKSKLISELIAMGSYDPEVEKKHLLEQLKVIRMSLIEPTFDKDGTQAILVEFSDHIVLAFRGTEATSIKDIKSDAKAKSIPCPSGGRIHQGFSQAFDTVCLSIQTELKKESVASKPLFITGHSLGGALATIAAKKLVHKAGIAACYTFGSPRVGDETWVSGMKTPLYRVVNAADCVTMLPPDQDMMTVLSWLIRLIPVVGKQWHKWILATFGGYYHGGDMKYLTNCPPGDFKDVELIYYVSGFYRMKAVIYKKLPWKTFLSDHSISVYRKKLQIIAAKRNDIK
ncbi:MAG: lipase family protein [Gammaproteobacteria bacterium]|nr:lipase family protein [Gammaproteobacteria bacterium]